MERKEDEKMKELKWNVSGNVKRKEVEEEQNGQRQRGSAADVNRVLFLEKFLMIIVGGYCSLSLKMLIFIS